MVIIYNMSNRNNIAYYYNFRRNCLINFKLKISIIFKKKLGIHKIIYTL
ncbi:hypothetical protein CNEO4_450004 [Clostridium neonatale]|uniref:Uncharacterized protein n=1 Tax=Clostridium neonatale TaxID=137838 RepID=A0AA86JQ11_9CLOT|nr:hypothetical protein CNEO_42980 [Clostridium neonatale]CAI3600004.1 hypothetical protein CNEO4_260039 [Clostridium neonatale]CAI3610121.1 hypothetical protein CNEO4_360039 [Clostridium neonatale]CAI3638816.1 hypothetical protein CNEO4_350041 [Clostridium neonatale]CAI3645039.1 hypothetical protein CNEO4_350041 [Clostridium neonatale]